MAFWSSKPSSPTAEAAELLCSFCGSSQREVRKLIAGPKVYICDRCVGLCNDIIVEEQAKEVIEPLALAHESLIMALERARISPLSVRRRIVEALLALATGEAVASRELMHRAYGVGDPAGALLALAAIPAASRTPEDAIYEAYMHEALGDSAGATAALATVDERAVSERTRALLPLHHAFFRFSAGVVDRAEAETHAQTVAALRASWSSLELDELEGRRVDRQARMVEAQAAHALGHFVRAESMLREHLLSSERDALAWALLFEVHAAQGQVEHASAARKKALAIVDPGSRLAEKLRARSVGPFR